MMTDVILHAPKKHERRHKQQHASAGPQHAAHLAQARNIVVKMLNHIQRSHEIESARVVRQRLSRTQLDVRQSARATKLERIVRDINSLCITELRKHLQVRASTAPDVENFRPAVGVLPADLFYEARDDASPP